MKLLIVTQVVDATHSDLGFFHTWIEEFAHRCEAVTVICLYKGTYTLPQNVRVLSLGKETGTSRIQRLARLFRYVWQERARYDSVFVHMNPEYIVLAGWFWKLWHKRVVLWYVHKQISLRLKVALWFVDAVCTTSTESFRVASPKVVHVGHGIPEAAFAERTTKETASISILMVGRMSRSKGVKEGVEVLAALGAGYELIIVGGTHTPEDVAYEREVRALVAAHNLLGAVRFVGPVSPDAVRQYYATSDVFLHLSTTGSTDKVVLEALAAGLPVVSSSEAFTDVPGVHFIPERRDVVVAEAVRVARRDTAALVGVEYVRVKHSLGGLIARIVNILSFR
jgi:glycosyltransferase involved in cell wall biosynthesis